MVSDWAGRLPFPPGQDADEAEISREDLFRMLKSERRRYVLHYLKRVQRTDLDDLVETVTAWENQTSRDAVGPDETKRVRISLLQTHLSEMESAGLLHFDETCRVVEITEAADSLDIYLEIVPTVDIAWPEYYLGITVFNAVVLFLTWQDVYPFGILPDAIWGLFITGLFLLSAIVHHLSVRSGRLGRGSPVMPGGRYADESTDPDH